MSAFDFPNPTVVPGHTTETDSTIVLIGSPVFFPDCLLRFIQSELGSIRVSRVADARALAELTYVSGAPLACILQDSFVREAPEIIEQIAHNCGDASIALAYYDVEMARDLLHRLQQQSARRIGFLPLGGQLDFSLAAIRLITCGEAFIPGELAGPERRASGDAAAAEPAPAPASSPASSPAPSRSPIHGEPRSACLTERELEVLALVSSGKQNKSIAEELNLSEHTVKLHVHHVLKKLNVRNRTGATTWFLENRSRLGTTDWADV